MITKVVIQSQQDALLQLVKIFNATFTAIAVNKTNNENSYKSCLSINILQSRNWDAGTVCTTLCKRASTFTTAAARTGQSVINALTNI